MFLGVLQAVEFPIPTLVKEGLDKWWHAHVQNLEPKPLTTG